MSKFFTRKGPWPRRVAVVLTAASLATAMLPGPIAVADESASTGAETASPVTEARLEAARTGEPQVVPSLTTETSKVEAQPDGSLVLWSSLLPVRTHRDGQWVDIDPRLHRDDDGMLRPDAVPGSIAFSGGGSGPAVVVDHGGTSIELSWPEPLPAPRVQGASAYYDDVLPGVDLVLTARVDSYNEVLVVHDRQAAQNPRLASLKLGVKADDVRAVTEPNGDLIAANDTGDVLFHGSPPVMWDSSHALNTPVPTAQDPSTAVVTPIASSMPITDGTDSPVSSTLTLTPPETRLDGADVQYPVYIDPPLTPNRSHFSVVTTKDWHYYDDTSNDLKVGECDWSECDGHFKARTFLSFNTDALGDAPTTARVSSAKVQVYEVHNEHGCTAEDVDLYSSGSIDKQTDWPGPSGSKLDSASSKLGNTCNDSAGMVTFDGSKVVSYFQTAANNDTNTLTFGLRSPDEGDKYQWKRFSSAGGSSSSAAQIEVHYDFPPSTPYGLTLDNTVRCPGNPVYTRDLTPTVHARATDYNTPHLPVSLHFTVQNTAATVVRTTKYGVKVASGATASWSTNSSNTNSTAPVLDGHYGYRASATSPSDDTPDASSATTPWSYFDIDHVAPSVPAISSFDYPRNMWGTVSGGRFTLNASADTAGFVYSFDSAGDEPLPIDTLCSYTTTPNASGGRVAASGGVGSFLLPNLTVGYHTLYARGFDDAHNVSGESSAYVFYVAPSIANEGYTKHEAEASTIVSSGDSCVSSGCPSYAVAASNASGSKIVSLVADRGSEAAPAVFKTSAFTVNVAAEYAVDARVMTQNHSGILEFALDDQVLTRNGLPIKVNTYSPALGGLEVALGGRHLDPGQHTLSFLLVGTDPRSVNYAYSGNYGSPAVSIGSPGAPLNDNGYSALIDYVRVVGINNVTYSSLTAARNNDAIAVGNSTQADIGPSVAAFGLDQTAMTAAGFAPDSDVVVDRGTQNQSTFHLGSSTGIDNAIAMGQTVSLPADVDADYVDLLVNATCGRTSYQPSLQLTVNFADGRYSSTLVPSVPDWQDVNNPLTPAPGQDATETRVMTNDHVTHGRGLGSIPVSLYHLSIPTKSDHGSPVHSVTLPYLGSDLSERCDTPSLHVYSMSTH